MKTIRINPADNVAVAIEALKAGETVNIEGQDIALRSDVPAGHKILLTDLAEGENVIKYGYPIGHLKESHKQGDFICHDNIKTNLSGLLDYEYKPVGKDELTNPAYAEWFTKEQLTFIRTALGSLRFTQDELAHPIRGLSGGQKAKVLLMRLMLSRPDVLLADEPTRNLSPLSAPVMRETLRAFPGALICVTHDRLLIRDWPGRILRLTPEGLREAEDV
jgi:ATPase subunit of ABC transporter with duplicated ATPase domains